MSQADKFNQTRPDHKSLYVAGSSMAAIKWQDQDNRISSICETYLPTHACSLVQALTCIAILLWKKG